MGHRGLQLLVTLLALPWLPTSASPTAGSSNATATANTYADTSEDAQRILPLGLDALRSQKSVEAAHYRQFFYLGGAYLKNSTTGFTAYDNRTYVEQLLPVHGVKQSNPLIFIHGGGFAGTVNYLS